MKSKIAQDIYEGLSEKEKEQFRDRFSDYYSEIPTTSIEDHKLVVHNLTNIEGGIVLNIVQATALMIKLREYIVDYYKNDDNGI